MTVNPVCTQNRKKNISHIARSSVLKFIHMVKLVKKNFSEKKKTSEKNLNTHDIYKSGF